MSRYGNGKIPRSELVAVGPRQWLTRPTNARWKRLVADVKAREGVTLRISGGENGYRSYAGQVEARKAACARGRCKDAAVPGTSSHGGEYRGRDSLAIDVGNWAVLGKSKFYAYARKHGFEPNFFDWEPWHIIDWAPYTMPAPAPKPAPKPKPKPVEEEDEEMIVIVQRSNSQLTKGRLLPNGRIREITRFENTVYRSLESRDLAAFVTVEDSVYNALLKGSK